MPGISKDISSKVSKESEAQAESAEASGSEEGETKTGEKPIEGATLESPKEKKSPVVSPVKGKKSPVVSPARGKKSPVVSPAKEKKSPMVSPAKEKKSPMVSPAKEKKSPAVIPTKESSPSESPAGEKSTLEWKVSQKGEFVKPATGESTSLKIKQVGGPDPTTPSSPKVVISGSGGEYGSDEKQKSRETEEPSSERIPSEPAAEIEGTETKEKLDDSVYRCMFYMKHFRIDDISVQIDGQTVLIDAKHDHQVDEHGFVTRKFVRKHHLPENVIAEKFTTCLTGDGVLVFQAPRSKV